MYPSILYEDKSLVVLEKGPGMVVNRAKSAQGETLQDWVEENIMFEVQTSSNTNDSESDFVKRSGIVHRLDKDTSGVIICAKNEDAFYALQEQFKKREVKKIYTLLVHGHVKSDSGEISAPISRLPWNRMRFGVVAGGRDASTRYKVIERRELIVDGEEEKVTMVQAFPKTGRTHQLRVHFKHVHHPIFGDRLYVGRKVGRKDAEVLSRQFLHASEIYFVHPVKGEQVNFTSHLPPDLVKVTLQFLPVSHSSSNT